jgi:hypothetical protein
MVYNMKEIQWRGQKDNRHMHGELRQLVVTGQEETRGIGGKLQSLQLSGQEEITACLAQHNLRFDQLQGSLGLMEMGINNVNLKSDETLILVKQLASVIDRRTDGSAMICIRIPRGIYDPGLSMWNGVITPIPSSRTLC